MKHIITALTLIAAPAVAEPLADILDRTDSVPFESTGRIAYVENRGNAFWFLDENNVRFDMLVYNIAPDQLRTLRNGCALNSRDKCIARIEGHTVVVNSRIVLDVDVIDLSE